MNKAVISGLIVLLLVAAPTFAATIDVGTHWLAANTADQTIQIFVASGAPAEQVAGMNLFAQIGDGGPDMGGSQDGPEFTGYDLTTGTIWAVNPSAGQPSLAPGNQIIIGSVILATTGQTVVSNGMLATLKVSTVGWNSGTWDLKLTDTLDTPTELVDNNHSAIPVTIRNGKIIVPVPEPSTIIMLLGVLAAVPLGILWKKRK